MVFETERLYLREMTQADYEALCRIMQDAEAMRLAYERVFTDNEVQGWLDRHIARCERLGFGLWAVVLKETGAMIGQCGLTMQDCDGTEVVEVGYLFQKKFWHQGYAAEAATACRDYAFETLGASEVYSIIRDNNLASQRVAGRNGMTPRGQFVKHYYGMDMPHIIYSVKRREWDVIKNH